MAYTSETLIFTEKISPSRVTLRQSPRNAWSYQIECHWFLEKDLQGYDVPGKRS